MDKNEEDKREQLKEMFVLASMDILSIQEEIAELQAQLAAKTQERNQISYAFQFLE